LRKFGLSVGLKEDFSVGLFLEGEAQEDETSRRLREGDDVSFRKEFGESNSGRISLEIKPFSMLVFAKVKFALIAAPDRLEKELLVGNFEFEFGFGFGFEIGFGDSGEEEWRQSEEEL
jgi:hypothetical protein